MTNTTPQAKLADELKEAVDASQFMTACVPKSLLIDASIALRAQVAQAVPPIPTEAQWGGLARSIMLAFDVDAKTPRKLLAFLENVGEAIPQWLRDEQEMTSLDHIMSKGTRCTLIYRAMLASAPPAPVRQDVQGEPLLTITGYQLQQAMEFVAPDLTPEQLASEACIQHGPARSHDEGGDPAGLYCWLADYPEEGSISLATAQPIEQSEPAAENVADAEIKAMYVASQGSDSGWLGLEGSYFIGGVSAERRRTTAQAAPLAQGDEAAFAKWKAYPLPELNSDGHYDKDYLHREWVAFRAGRDSLPTSGLPGLGSIFRDDEVLRLTFDSEANADAFADKLSPTVEIESRAAPQQAALVPTAEGNGALVTLCRDFIKKHRIACAETIYQTDRVTEDATTFIEQVCDLVGYKSEANHG